jgi:hypothetical protein
MVRVVALLLVLLSGCAGSCSLSQRDLKPHDPRRGEAFIGGLTILYFVGRSLQRRVIDGRPSLY